MIFRQLYDTETSTYTYLLGDEATKTALLIDPVVEAVDSYAALLDELGLRLIYTLETHVHADHVTGGGVLRERLGSQTIVHEAGGAPCASLHVHHGDKIKLGAIELEVRETPGHTDGCVSFVGADRVFTGDALLIGGCGRTDFQQGDPGKLYDSLHSQIFSLPPDTLVYPGHDYRGRTVTTVKEELALNARLGAGRTRESFIELMNALNLPVPKHIARAVPANQACGIEAVPQG